jgi:hypothetical protein
MTLSGVMEPCTPTPELPPHWPPARLISITHNLYTRGEGAGMTCVFHSNTPEFSLKLKIFVRASRGCFRVETDLLGYCVTLVVVPLFQVTTYIGNNNEISFTYLL